MTRVSQVQESETTAGTETGQILNISASRFDLLRVSLAFLLTTVTKSGYLYVRVENAGQ